MTFLRYAVAVLFLATVAHADTLPGFRLEPLARAEGFVSSIVTDSQGTVYFTTTDGWIHRLEGTQTVRVSALPTRAGGNGGLLGMVLVDDNTAVVHYTTWTYETGELAKVLDDVIARVDLRHGFSKPLQTFACDINNRNNGASSEHHGGNLALGPDGTVFVGIGEYGGHLIAQKPEWNGGKVWRVNATTGETQQWAIGVRNPYDVAWDPDLGRLIVSDNGEAGGDELHIVEQGDNCGWPWTYGTQPPLEGAVPPVFVWPQTVAPTGLLRLDGANPMLRRGYLSGAFVTRALYYFPSLATRPVPAPIAIAEELPEYVIDVAQAPTGEIYVATAGWTGTVIQRLHVPPRGDCNGDGAADWRDVYPMMLEIGDSTSAAHSMMSAQNGDYEGSWGCDANADGLIDASDLDALATIIGGRQRAVRR
ncbi:MAG TPA: PQQ-dependent sugar dehydrogenase [Thermoanaerobaculia bacterium]|nr:PQQ-dependent sugar dehydrogenase [Thermoanaerobaculia bacterium]